MLTDPTIPTTTDAFVTQIKTIMADVRAAVTSMAESYQRIIARQNERISELEEDNAALAKIIDRLTEPKHFEAAMGRVWEVQG